MRIYDIYGIKESNIIDAARKLEEVLGITFKAHDSSYKGVYYADESSFFELCNNLVDENDWLEDEFRDDEIILYVNNHSDPEVILTQLLESTVSCTPLRRTEIIPGTLFRVYHFVNNQFTLKLERMLPPEHQ